MSDRTVAEWRRAGTEPDLASSGPRKASRTTSSVVLGLTGPNASGKGEVAEYLRTWMAERYPDLF